MASKRMKMRINNASHSRAVQRWLFGQDYGWELPNRKVYQFLNREFIYTNVSGPSYLSASDDVIGFTNHEAEEVDVNHLDPLYKPKDNDHLPKQKEVNLFKILDNLYKLQKAIDRADNKQAKRIQDRDRSIVKINKMLPKGWSLVNNAPSFNPNEIEEGSVWECTSNARMCFSDCSVGGHYTMHICDDLERYYFTDDKGYEILRGKNPIIDSFKRVK